MTASPCRTAQWWKPPAGRSSTSGQRPARVRRQVSADDPADLGSPLSYSVEVLAADDDENLDPAGAALSKSRQWVLTALRTGGELQTERGRQRPGPLLVTYHTQPQHGWWRRRQRR